MFHKVLIFILVHVTVAVTNTTTNELLSLEPLFRGTTVTVVFSWHKKTKTVITPLTSSPARFSPAQRTNQDRKIQSSFIWRNEEQYFIIYFPKH